MGHKAYGKAVDWWALGVICYEMLTGTILFEGRDQRVLFRNILSHPISLPPKLSPDCREVRRPPPGETKPTSRSPPPFRLTP